MMTPFHEYDLTEEQQKEQQDWVDKELIKRRKVIPTYNEIAGLKDIWITLQQNKGNYFPKTKEYIKYFEKLHFCKY
jgi:regulator of sigma D